MRLDRRVRLLEGARQQGGQGPAERQEFRRAGGDRARAVDDERGECGGEKQKTHEPEKQAYHEAAKQEADIAWASAGMVRRASSRGQFAHGSGRRILSRPAKLTWTPPSTYKTGQIDGIGCVLAIPARSVLNSQRYRPSTRPRTAHAASVEMEFLT